jgi:hypothetical protein
MDWMFHIGYANREREREKLPARACCCCSLREAASSALLIMAFILTELD